jgi:hypothetical protein
MKKIFSLTLGFTICVTICIVRAQDSGAVVPIGFVNAVGLSSKTEFQIDGQILKPAGFTEGGYASSFGLSAGNHQFSFANGDSEKVSRAIEIKERYSPLFVLYKVVTPRNDGTVKNILKLSDIPPQPMPRGARFYAFSTIEGKRATLRANGSVLSIEPLKLTLIADGSLTVEGEGLKSLHTKPNESGNYILVLFEGANSRMKWSLVEMTR